MSAPECPWCEGTGLSDEEIYCECEGECLCALPCKHCDGLGTEDDCDGDAA